MNDQSRPSLRAYLKNWGRRDMTFATKVRLAVQSVFKRVKSTDSCCGDPGNPGC